MMATHDNVRVSYYPSCVPGQATVKCMRSFSETKKYGRNETRGKKYNCKTATSGMAPSADANSSAQRTHTSAKRNIEKFSIDIQTRQYILYEQIERRCHHATARRCTKSHTHTHTYTRETEKAAKNGNFLRRAQRIVGRCAQYSGQIAAAPSTTTAFPAWPSSVKVYFVFFHIFFLLLSDCVLCVGLSIFNLCVV